MGGQGAECQDLEEGASHEVKGGLCSFAPSRTSGKCHAPPCEGGVVANPLSWQIKGSGHLGEGARASCTGSSVRDRQVGGGRHA